MNPTHTLSTHVFAHSFVGKQDNRSIFRVDTAKAKYHDISWTDLGDFGKRKFENILALTNGGLVKVLYD